MTGLERYVPDLIGECVVFPAVLDAASQIKIPKAMRQFAGLSLMYCCSEACVAALRGTSQLDGASNYICSSTIAGEGKDQVDRDKGFDQLKTKLAVDGDLAHCDQRRRVAI